MVGSSDVLVLTAIAADAGTFTRVCGVVTSTARGCHSVGTSHDGRRGGEANALMA